MRMATQQMKKTKTTTYLYVEISHIAIPLYVQISKSRNALASAKTYPRVEISLTDNIALSLISNSRIWKAISFAEPTTLKRRLHLDTITTVDMKLR